MLLSGGFASNVALIMNETDGLWVYSAQNDIFVGEAGRGIQRVGLHEYLDDAYAAAFDLGWLNLHEDLRNTSATGGTAAWDEAKFHEWYPTLENSTYSQVKEYFAAIDTVDDSYPAPLTSESVPIFLRDFEDWIPDGVLKREFMEALGKRFTKISGTAKEQLPKTLEEMIVYGAVELNMSIQELLAEPELDEWRYDVFQGNQSFTASSFVVEAYKKLGIFTNATSGETLEINAAEFSPKDVYQMNLFKYMHPATKPFACLEADAYLPFC
jgi:hypothetical protein